MRRPPFASLAALLGGLVVVAIAGVVWWHQGGQLRAVTSTFVLACALAVTVGEAIRTTVGLRTAAPISLAAGLALAMTPVEGRNGSLIGPADVVLVVAAALLVGACVRYAFGRAVGTVDLVTRLLGVTACAMVVRDAPIAGRSLLEWTTSDDRWPWLVAVGLVAASGLGVGVDAVLRAWSRARRIHTRLPVVLTDDLGGGGGLSLSVVVTGPLIVLARPVVGTWAVPMCLLPLVMAQLALRRHGSVSRTYRQTVAALSRLTDVAGYTRAGHARRVAATSIAVGRELGLPEKSLISLEYAALLHDLGQVALRHPIPGGATVLAAPGDQQRIADDGATIIRRTGVLDEVARVVEKQSTPFRIVREFDEHLPVETLILKVVNAFDDLTAGSADQQAVATAMERIALGLGYEYDPVVVEALQRVLERQSVAP